MMSENWLRTKIIDGVAETSNAQTKKIDLPTSNFIGMIHLRCGATVLNAGSDADMTTNVLLDMIQRIRVVGDGYSTIVDLTPDELRKIMVPIMGGFPSISQNEDASSVQYVDLPICMGRFPYDEDYILPAKLFKSLQLEIQYNLSDIVDPGFTTGTFTIWLEVDELISNSDPLSKKIIRRTEVKTATTAAGNIDIDMPLGGVYKRFMVIVEDRNANDNVDVTDVQVRVNNGAEIPLTSGWDILQAQNKEEFGLPLAEGEGIICKADNGTYETRLGTIQSVVVQPVDAQAVANALASVSVDGVAGGTITLTKFYSAALTEAVDANRTVTADATIRPTYWHAQSKNAIPETVIIPFDKGGDMSKCPDSSRFNDCKVRLTGANASATYYVVLEEVLHARS